MAGKPGDGQTHQEGHRVALTQLCGTCPVRACGFSTHCSSSLVHRPLSTVLHMAAAFLAFSVPGKVFQVPSGMTVVCACACACTYPGGEDASGPVFYLSETHGLSRSHALQPGSSQKTQTGLQKGSPGLSSSPLSPISRGHGLFLKASSFRRPPLGAAASSQF